MNSTMLGSTPWDLEALFCLATRIQKHKPYPDSPQNYANFEYKVDLFLNCPLAPPLGMNPNVAPCQIRTMCTVSIYVQKPIFFLIFVLD
jgi:hypothetical protein